MKALVFLSTLLLGSCLAATASVAGVRVQGKVFADVDGDGLFSPGDKPLPGLVVAWETSIFVTTAGDGSFTIDAPAEGIVWARSPDGFRPGPVWHKVVASEAGIELAMKPTAIDTPLSFVHASDTHIGVVNASETALALTQAADAVPTPRFLVITGDITQGNQGSEFDGLTQALADVDIPFVPVPGNHDWYDGGAAYRARLGPPNYSFDSGGVHFIVMNQPLGQLELLDFVDRDLASVPAGTKIAAFMHGPPALNEDAEFVAGMQARGISTLFTGHWHGNRIMFHGPMIEYNIQPVVMGGLDGTPGGYSIVSLADTGDFISEHHITVEHAVLEVVHPLPASCVAPGEIELAVAIEVGGGALAVTAAVDGGAPFALGFQGGWRYGAPLRLEAAGGHQLSVRVSGHGAPRTLESTFCVDENARPPVPAQLPDWPQLQGGPTHVGVADAQLEPPLATVWTAAVGGHIYGGSPVLSGGRLFVPVIDLGDRASGGLVAFDAASGRLLWERRFAASMRSAPAVDGDVVVAITSVGVARGLDVATGEERWEVDIASGLPNAPASSYGAPMVTDGVVFLSCVRNLVGIETSTGAVVWQQNPAPRAWLGLADSSPGIEDGRLVLLPADGGVLVTDPLTGATSARMDLPVGPGVATPMLAGGLLYGATNDTTAFAFDLAAGRLVWSTQLDADGFDYGVWARATPALAGGLLLVPTLKDYLYAVRIEDGSVAWRLASTTSVLHTTHYQARAAAFAGAPVVTGGIIWVGGADGILRAVDLADGQQLWSLDLHAPIMSGAVPAGSMLFVGTWDGTIRALAHVERTLMVTPKPEPPAAGGCALTVSARGGATSVCLGLLVVVVGVVLFAGGRRRRPRPR